MVVTLGQQYNIGEKPTVMETKLQHDVLREPKKGSPYLPQTQILPVSEYILFTYTYLSEQIQTASKEDLSRPSLCSYL